MSRHCILRFRDAPPFAILDQALPELDFSLLHRDQCVLVDKAVFPLLEHMRNLFQYHRYGGLGVTEEDGRTLVVLDGHSLGVLAMKDRDGIR